ncbi:cyclic lactone autoinducer peptide [Metaclostridioides mangenotii]|nr:cyclic lactone autoinducer peptide [Clostridioides mangenotii]
MEIKRTKLWKFFAILAPIVAASSINTTCMWTIHQPEIPEEVKRMKKLK